MPVDVDKFYYAGVWTGQTSGHYVYDRFGRMYFDTKALGWPARVSNGVWGKLCVNGEDSSSMSWKVSQPEGQANLRHVDGWTLLCFWDRSADQRGGCTSAFVIQGELSFAEMCSLAAEHFEIIWKRYPFKVELHSSVELTPNEVRIKELEREVEQLRDRLHALP